MDIVFLTGLRVETTIGIYDWEKSIRQPVILDLEMAADVAQAAATDDIAQALDYKAVAQRLKVFIRAARFELVETLAEACVTLVREEFAVPWVRLRLNKIGALSDVTDVGVVIERGHKPA